MRGSSIALFACLVWNFFGPAFHASVATAVPTAALPPAGASASAGVPETRREILYVPQEAATLSWERDVGIARSEVLRCEDDNESAAWFELCRSLMSISLTFVNLTVGETALTPTVRLHTKRGIVRLVFRQAQLLRVESRAAPLPLPRIHRNEDGALTCAFDAPLPQGWQKIRQEWRVQRKAGETPLTIDDTRLAATLLGGALEVRCVLVVFDGTLFVPRETKAPPMLARGEVPAAAAPLTLTASSHSDFSADRVLGRARAGETFRCRLVWGPENNIAGSLEPDPCTRFDARTGAFDPRVLEELGRNAFDPSGTLFQVELARGVGSAAAARVSLPLLVSDADLTDESHSARTGPNAPEANRISAGPGLFVREERGAFFSHLICARETGTPVLTPVTWKADGTSIPGWQLSWLPAFLLSGSENYTCETEAQASAPFPYDETRAAFRPPSEIRVPPGATSVLFRVRVPPHAKSSGPLECTPPAGGICTVVADASQGAGEVLLNLEHVTASPPTAPRPQSADRTVEAVAESSGRVPHVTLTLSTAVGMVSREVPIYREGPAGGDEARTVQEVALTYQDGAWNCVAPSRDEDATADARPESIAWFLGGAEVVARRDHASFSLPAVDAPTSLLCVRTHIDRRTLTRKVSYAQTLLQPRGPAFDEAGGRRLFVLDGAGPLTVHGLQGGASINSARCVLTLSTGESDIPCSYTPSVRHALKDEPSAFRLDIALDAASQTKLRKRILASARILDPFEPVDAVLRVTLRSARATFTLETPLSLVVPNQRPRLRLFAHFTSARGSLECVALATDPEQNHLSLTLSPRFHPTGRRAFTTRDPAAARASLEGFFTHGSARNLEFGASLPARAVFEGPRTSVGCEALVSDGTSLFLARSVPLTESSARTLLTGWQTSAIQSKRASESGTQKERGLVDAVQVAQTSDTRPSENVAPAPSSQVTPPVVAPSVVHVRYHLTEAGTRALPFTWSTSGSTPISSHGTQARTARRLESCRGSQPLCGALFLKDGVLAAAVTSSVPGGFALVTLQDGPRVILLAAEFTSGIYTPQVDTEPLGCAALLARDSEMGLPSFVRLSIAARTENPAADTQRDWPVPASRALAALSAGADDIVCDSSLQWKGATIASRSSSLRETLFARRTSANARRPVWGDVTLQGATSFAVPSSGLVLLPSLVAALEDQEAEGDFAPSRMAVGWTLSSCAIEMNGKRTQCAADPSSLLISGLPLEGNFRIEATLVQRILGRPRRVRISQAFRGRAAAIASVLASVELRRDASGLQCTIEGHFPLGTVFRYDIFRNQVPHAGGTTTERTFFVSEKHSDSGDASCHVVWNEGAESAFLPARTSDLTIESLCLVSTNSRAEPRRLPCQFPDSIAVGTVSQTDLENLRQRLERDAGVAAEAWVKWIVFSRSQPWRQSFLLTPTAPETRAVPRNAARRALFNRPWTRNTHLCLVSNSQDETAVRSDEPASTAASVRRLQLCSLLQSAPSDPETIATFDNPSAFGRPAIPVSGPFVAGPRQSFSAARRAFTPLEAPLALVASQGIDCVLRCKAANVSSPLTTSSCRDALSALTAAPGSTCKAEDSPNPSDEDAKRAPVALAPQAVGTVLELVLKKRDNSGIVSLHPLGIIVP